MNDEKIRIPYFLSWRLKRSYPPDDIAVMVRPSKPIEWTLKRILGDWVLSGKEIFFQPYNELIDIWQQDGSHTPLPFYLGPLVGSINTNDERAVKNLLYDFGAFEMEADVQEVTSLKDIFPLFVSLLPNPNVNNIKVETAIVSRKSNPWTEIFKIAGAYKNFKVFWIEDNLAPLSSLGIKVNEQLKKDCKDKINLFKIVKTHSEIKAELICASQDLKAIKEELNKKVKVEKNKLDSFNIYIIDMYYDIKDENNEQKLHIYGDDFVQLIRDKEKNIENGIKSLIIVYTGGDSPFIISRTKSLDADLVLLKQMGETKGHVGHNMTSPDGKFFLLWSLYWPLVILKHICLRLEDIKKIADIKGRTEILELLKRTKSDLGKLCPGGIFYFKEAWTQEVNRILSKWIFILNSTIKVFDRNSREELRTDLKKLLELSNYNQNNCSSPIIEILDCTSNKVKVRY